MKEYKLKCLHCKKEYLSPNNEKFPECIDCYSNKWITKTAPFCRIKDCNYCLETPKNKQKVLNL